MIKGCSNPGHGGGDSGAVGSRSLEKDINLQVSLKFAKRMREHGFEMVETRTVDSFVSLSEITGIANRANVEFFQSNHCNAGGGHGFEIYVLPGGKAEQWAEIMAKHLAKNLGISNRGIKKDKKFYVLVNTTMPAILVELAFIDDKNEEELLLNQVWQAKAVEGMVQAWCEVYQIGYIPPGQQIPTQPPVVPPDALKPPQLDKQALVKDGLDYLRRCEEIIAKLGEN